MPDNLNRTILLRLALILVAAVLADKIFLSTGMSSAETQSRIAFLKSELQRGFSPSVTDEQVARCKQAEDNMASTFSRPRYLESLIGQSNIVSVEPSSPSEIPDWADHSMVSYRLRLKMPLPELHASLEALDRENYPLRVERLRILPTDQQRQMLTIEMTVTTIVQTAAISGAVVTSGNSEAPEPYTRRLPQQELKNIFFPILSDTDQPPLAAESVVRRFVLSGIDLESKPARALLIFQQTNESIWIETGSAIDDARLISLDENSALFEIGRQRTRLPLGSSSELLLIGKRRFKSSCVITGIIRHEGQYLALASFGAAEGMALIGVGDELPTGRIIAIGEEYVTLDNAGREEIIPLGNSTDTPIYPGYPMMGTPGGPLE